MKGSNKSTKTNDMKKIKLILTFLLVNFTTIDTYADKIVGSEVLSYSNRDVVKETSNGYETTKCPPGTHTCNVKIDLYESGGVRSTVTQSKSSSGNSSDTENTNDPSYELDLSGYTLYGYTMAEIIQIISEDVLNGGGIPILH